nr:glycoside hydrolase N-terminal domain-containing protein [Sphingomonas sp. H160509]
MKRSVGTAAALGLPHPGLAAQSSKSPDTRLWYRQPAERWVEALPIGNGRIGAMVLGGVDHERLQLNEDTLWSGGPYNPVNPDALAALPEVRRLVFAGRLREAQALANAKLMGKPLSQMSYQTLGDLFISLPTITADSVRDYERALDLDTAVATTGFAAGTVRHERSVFACPVHQVIAVRLVASKAGSLDCDIGLRSPQSGTLTIADDTLILSGRNSASEGIAGALRFEARARVLHEGRDSGEPGWRDWRARRPDGHHPDRDGDKLPGLQRRRGRSRHNHPQADRSGCGRRVRSYRGYRCCRAPATLRDRAHRSRPDARCRPTYRRAHSPERNKRRSGTGGIVLQLRPIPADRLVSSRIAALQSSGHLERSRAAALGLQVHDQHQHGDELLAGRADRPGRMHRPTDRDGPGACCKRRENRT